MRETLEGVEFRARKCPSCQSIVAPIMRALEGCFWAFEGDVPFGSFGAASFPEGEELFALFEVDGDRPEKSIWADGWLRPDGIHRMLPFVHSDWLDVYAVAAPPFPRRWVADVSTVRPLVAIPGLALYMECVDGALWRAWSPIQAIGAALRSDPPARPARWDRA